MTRVVYLVVCGAGPALYIDDAVTAARAGGWDCHIITTPSARAFVNVDALEERTGNPVVSEHRRPGTPRRPRPQADAVIVAPATANSICKLGAGIADTYALDIVAECIGLGVPTVVAPFVNRALRRPPFHRAVAALREEGVTVLDIPAHEPKTGGPLAAAFPWKEAFAAASGGQT